MKFANVTIISVISSLVGVVIGSNQTRQLKKNSMNLTQAKKKESNGSQQPYERLKAIIPKEGTEYYNNHSIADLLINTLSTLEKEGFHLKKVWQASSNGKRYIFNISPVHTDGTHFTNVHKYISKDGEEVFIEAHHSKKYAKQIIEKYIKDMLKDSEMDGKI